LESDTQLSTKHKIVAALASILLLGGASFFVLYIVGALDDVADRKPMGMSEFKGKSFALTISKPTNFSLNIRYLNSTKKYYISKTKNGMTKDVASLSNDSVIERLLDTDFDVDSCKLKRDVFQSIFNSDDTKNPYFTLNMESLDDKSSLRIDIVKNTDESYHLDILQTSSQYIELSTKNIHRGIDQFECDLPKSNKFIVAFKNLISI
jgi:hypothetical protein